MKLVWGTMQMTPLSKTIRFTRPLVGARLVEPGTDTTQHGQVHALDDTPGLSSYEIEAIREKAFQAGEQSAREKAEVVYQDELAAKIGLCEKAAGELMNLKQDLIDEMHGAVAELVLEAAGRLMEGWEPDEAGVKKTVEALLEDFDPGDHRMRIRLNPESLELLTGSTTAQFEQSYPQLEFTADAHLKPGECQLEGRFGLADARYSEKLKNLSEVLTDD